MSRPDIAHPPLPQPGSLVPPIYARLLRMLLQHADVDGDRVLAAAGLDWATLVTDDKRLGRDAERWRIRVRVSVRTRALYAAPAAGAWPTRA